MEKNNRTTISSANESTDLSKLEPANTL